jgi:predicted phosphatase
MTLWNGYKLYPDVRDILRKLKNKGDKIFIASFNMFAPQILRILDIEKYFMGGSYGRGFTKYDMIVEIQEYLNDYDTQVRFYDDLEENILEVRKKALDNIRAIYVENGLKKEMI